MTKMTNKNVYYTRERVTVGKSDSGESGERVRVGSRRVGGRVSISSMGGVELE